MSDSESIEEEIISEDEEESDQEEDIELTIKEQISGIKNTIIREKKRIVVPRDQRRTSNYATKTELVEIIGTRAALTEKGAPSYTEIGDLKNHTHIAIKEMLEGNNPQKIERVIRETPTEKVVEIWYAREMVVNLENYIEIVPEAIFRKIQEGIDLSTSKTQESNKKGGNETLAVPPIIYWYNGTKMDKYNFLNGTNSEILEKINYISDDIEERKETLISLDNRSEYEKVVTKNKDREDYYFDIRSTYSEVVRALTLIAWNGSDDVIIDLELDPKKDRSIFLCLLQVIKYYYRDVAFGKIKDRSNTIRIIAKHKNNVHYFYNQTLLNLIDLPEVNSIFLQTDLMKI